MNREIPEGFYYTDRYRTYKFKCGNFEIFTLSILNALKKA